MGVSNDEDDVFSPDGKDSSILMEEVASFLSRANARELMAFWLLDKNVKYEAAVQPNDVQDMCGERSLSLIRSNVGLVRKELGD